MPITVTLVLVVVFAVLVSAVLHRVAGGRFVVSGVGYVAIGGALGPFGLGLLNAQVMSTLQPFVSLMLGMVGFSLGLALRKRLVGAAALEAGVVSALLCGGAVFTVMYFVLGLPIFATGPFTERLWPALAIGSAAAAISAHGIEASITAHRARGSATELLRAYALSGSVVAVAASGVALALSRSHQTSNRLGLGEQEWLVALLAVGLVCGVLFALFMGKNSEQSDDRLFLASVGIIIFASGMGVAAGVAPLFLNTISGMAVSVLSKDAQRLHDRLERLERPALITLMIFAGAMWWPVTGLWWILPGVYLAARIVAMRLSASTSSRIFPGVPRVHRLGSALSAQGGVAVAVAVNYAQVYPDHSAIVLTTVLVALFASDIGSPAQIRRFLMDAGEHDRAEPEPVAAPVEDHAGHSDHAEEPA